jgi:hypothetical protein
LWFSDIPVGKTLGRYNCLETGLVTRDVLKDFSIVELKLAIKRIIRCYMNDLGRKPTVKEIDSHYRKAIIEFLGERTSWFQKEKGEAQGATRPETAADRTKKGVDDTQLKLLNL